MNPIISEQTEDDQFLKFRISNINVSLANAIRRIILSEIPTLVFRTTPHSQNKSTIITNTSRLNNELIKQRLSCIPIHITDTAFEYDKHMIEIQKKNDSGEVVYVTTNDIKIKNTQNDMYLSKEACNVVFPPNKITGDYIDLVRLRPRLSETMPGEELHLTCLFDIGNAKEDGAYNVASTCSYSSTKDLIKANSAWTEIQKQLKKDGLDASTIDEKKQDWLSIDAKRFIIKDSFDFIIETVGPFPNTSIIEKACGIMIDKLTKFQDDIQTKDKMIEASASTIENCYDITLIGEDYTLGKAMEYTMYSKYYDKPNSSSEKLLTYCGFRKPHPHIDISIIRLGFKNPVEISAIITYLIGAADDCKSVYEKIMADFSTQ